ncbi:MAG TPA: SIMPL domain-containing protein [Solirubrobacterales bacterium]|nr:SIMPL domain-containing protein [Solirubrobacterales bacterium]
MLALLVLLLLAPATAAAQERTIAVKGAATLAVPNDTASLGLSVSKERKTRAAALRIVAIRLREVIAVAQTSPGVGPGDVTTGRISLRKLTRDKRTVYRASEGISVILHQPDRAGELIGAAIAAGATGTRGPSFFPGNPDLAYENVLIAAFAQAKAKATAVAQRAGATLGPAISIEEGTEAIPSPAAEQKGSSQTPEPSPPVKPGTSTVTATVRVVFALQ